MLEDSAYRRLIDAYYTRELPLPADRKACQKLARAQSKDERAAVDYVLDEYFKLDEDGWHQSRCDLELSKYFQKQPAAEEKKDNARERQRKSRERRKALFDELAALGFNMPFNATTELLQTELSRIKSRHVTPPVTRDNTCTQPPVPSNQSPVSKQPPPVTQTESRDEPDELAVFGVADAAIPETPTNEGHWMAWFNREAGTQFDASSRFDRGDLWPIFGRWCKAGITQQQMQAAIQTAQETATAPIANLPKYVDRVLANSQAPQRISHSDQSKLAASRAIFGTEIEGDQHGQGNRIIDVTPTIAAIRGR